MTQEQKAKAYDELKVKAQELTEDGYIDKLALLDLFPELRESEGERAKKEIIELVMQPTWKTEEEFHRRKELCAWLEKQKPAWSEEDELMLTSIIQTLKLTNGAAQMKIDWLKSLKDRVQPQPKWKPSDEQIEALESATENCAYSEYQDCLRELIWQLKKLRKK